MIFAVNHAGGAMIDAVIFAENVKPEHTTSPLVIAAEVSAASAVLAMMSVDAESAFLTGSTRS